MKQTEVKMGSKVHYVSPHGTKENGIVKSICEDNENAFVVYHCNGEWSKYYDYTGVHTQLTSLRLGWINDAQTKNPNQP